MLYCIPSRDFSKLLFSLDIDVPNNCTAKQAMQNYLPSKYRKLLSKDVIYFVFPLRICNDFVERMLLECIRGTTTTSFLTGWFSHFDFILFKFQQIQHLKTNKSDKLENFC